MFFVLTKLNDIPTVKSHIALTAETMSPNNVF